MEEVEQQEEVKQVETKQEDESKTIEPPKKKVRIAVPKKPTIAEIRDRKMEQIEKKLDNIADRFDHVFKEAITPPQKPAEPIDIISGPHPLMDLI